MTDNVNDFIAAMRAAGVDPVEPIAGKLLSGKIVRFRCQGDGKKRNGWALFFRGDAPGERAGGVFGNHKQQTGKLVWQAERQGPVLSPAERARLRQQWADEDARRAQALFDAQAAARVEAVTLWRGAVAASPDHPYAAKKRMRVGGLRQDGKALLVPMRDIDGKLWNVQKIFPDGFKRFLEGGRVIGLCALIGLQPEFRRGIFAEGYATGEAISQAVGGRWPVVVAFNTANLDPVVASWTARHPLADWIIAADDDHGTGLRMVALGKPYQNPGIDKAQAVGAARGCRVALPPRAEGDPVNVDFSDLWLADRAGDIVDAINGARVKVDPAGTVLTLAERIGALAATQTDRRVA